MILHVLNGDSTYYIFKNANIEGDIVIWREVFSEGLVNYPMSSKKLWTVRENELIRLYGINAEEYKSRTIDEISKIGPNYKEIVLWFEYDFYCQINMIATLSYLYNLHLDFNKISCHLICVGSDILHGKMATLSDYPVESYQKLYHEKSALNITDIQYTNRLFEQFTSKNPNDFYTLLENTNSFIFFDLLKSSYRKLFQKDTDDLSEFDQLIQESFYLNHNSLNALVHDILKKSTDFGFGDSQVMTKIKSFQNNIQSINPPRLNMPLSENLSADYIGNVNRRKWFFDAQKQKFFSFKS